jgi:two-component system sensor histidine kinase ChiS
MIPKTASGSLIGLADDDPKMIRLLRKNLEQAGYRVATASDGPGAIELVENQEPDLLVLDIVMPGMDGCKCSRGFASSPGCPSSSCRGRTMKPT